MCRRGAGRALGPEHRASLGLGAAAGSVPAPASSPAGRPFPPADMSSPSSGERYEEEEEEEEEDGAYESQAKRLKPSAAAEEGEIEYSGAEESEGRRDKPPASRGSGGGFSGGVRDAGPAGGGRLPSGCRGGGGPSRPAPAAGEARPPPPLLPAEGRGASPGRQAWPGSGPSARFPGMEALPAGWEWRGLRAGSALRARVPARARAWAEPAAPGMRGVRDAGLGALDSCVPVGLSPLQVLCRPCC